MPGFPIKKPRQPCPETPGSGDAKPRQPCHPNLLITDDRTSAPTADTEPGGPRQRAVALGPHPLGALEPDLRKRLGENFKWLSMARLLVRAAETVTLSVLTAYPGDNIRKHCEADILAVAGATQLEFVIELTVDLPKQRRLP